MLSFMFGPDIAYALWLKCAHGDHDAMDLWLEDE